MKLLACLLLCAAPVFCDTFWTLTSSSPEWGIDPPVFDLIVPVGSNGEATNVTSWSTQPDPEFGDITDYLGIYWPIVPGTPVGPAAPYGPPETLFAREEIDLQPSGLFFNLGGMYGLNTSTMEAIYEASEFGDTVGPYGPFTVADPPLPSVPEPASWMLAFLGALLVLPRWLNLFHFLRK